MKINKISQKLIKPHTPTPPDLNKYNISFIDKIQPPANFAVVLFYESKPPEIDTQLEESLAKTLVQFYLLAGRYIKSDYLVDCSDQGVEFVVAESLDDDEVGAKTTHAEQISDLVPDQYFRVDEAPTDPLMSIQTTHFPCGGLTIAISVSHRVFDGSSLGTFIAAWSTNTTNLDHKMAVQLTPQSFDLPVLLPNKTIPGKNYNYTVPPQPRFVIKRLVFNKEALTSLKSKIGPRNGKPVSRVRVVSAVIAKALIKLDTAKHGRGRDFVISQPVNMRERTIPPVSKHACGNLSVCSFTRRVEAKEMGVEELVDLIGDGVRKSITHHAEIVSPNNNIDGRDIIASYLAELIRLYTPEMNVVSLTDWSKFGFYKADFGWGKPLWTSIPPASMGNSTVLMSNKEGDGIEAWVHLNEDDMPHFDQDEDIKNYFEDL